MTPTHPHTPSRRLVRLATCLALLATAATASAQAPEDPTLPFEQYQLDNGLNVILHRDAALPLVAVNLWYRVGSKDEKPGRSGFAHLFEHLMFMGTARVPSFDVVMESGGGWNNASTAEDRTNYYSVGPANLLDTLLYLDADRLDALDDTMNQEKLDLQRDVVRNERRQSYENEPYGKAWLVIPEVMFPVGHPYHFPVIGSHEDLEAAKVEDVVSFFRTYYVPANASLVVAGDFDLEATKATIKRYFGDIPAGAAAAPTAPAELPAFSAQRQVLTDRVQLPKVMKVWRSAPFLKPGDAEMDIASSILARGKNSRLYRSLVYDQQIADGVEAYQSSMLYGSLFIIEATAQPGHTAEELEAAIDAELTNLRSAPPTGRELDRAKNNIEKAFIQRLESIGDRADLLNQYLYYTGTADFLGQDLERYRKVTTADIQQQVAATLTPETCFTLVIVPESAPTATTTP